MAIERPNISSLVPGQLPEFVREDYETFVLFLKAYYEYLDSLPGKSLHTYRDLDKTLDQFIIHFKNELAPNYYDILGNQKFVLSHLKDVHLSKGSEESFKLLFRLMFGKNVELQYPGQQMLRASDGKWNQDIAVYVKVDYGDITDIVGKIVNFTRNDRTIKVVVDKKENIIGDVDRIQSVDGKNTYQLFLDKQFFGDVQPGDLVKYGTKFQATVIPATQKLKILQGGKNFRIGQVFEVKTQSGTPALVKVNAVDAQNNNAIKYAEFIRFGIGYENNFTYSFLSSNGISSNNKKPTQSSSYVNGELSLIESTNGTSEQGYISKPNYFSLDYADGTYAGDTLREFSLDYRNSSIDPQESAILEISLGALVRYPGYYNSNNGFLSDSIYIQDSKYYQSYSYVIKIDERLSSYKSAVKSLIHPAGMALFGEYNITNNISLNIGLDCVITSSELRLKDSVAPRDLISSFYVSKPLSEDSVPSDSISKISVSKKLEDSFDVPTDSATLLFGKKVSDSISTQDSKVIQFAKRLVDTPVILESKSISIGKYISDAPSIVDAAAVRTNKYVTEVISDFSSNGSVYLNPYSGQQYFAEDYNAFNGSQISI